MSSFLRQKEEWPHNEARNSLLESWGGGWWECLFLVRAIQNQVDVENGINFGIKVITVFFSN